MTYNKKLNLKERTRLQSATLLITANYCITELLTIKPHSSCGLRIDCTVILHLHPIRNASPAFASFLISWPVRLRSAIFPTIQVFSQCLYSVK